MTGKPDGDTLWRASMVQFKGKHMFFKGAYNPCMNTYEGPLRR